jgi:hypothetical protein
MNLKQWIEISSIIGYLDGMASVLDMTEEVDLKKIKTGLISLKDRLITVHDSLGPEVIENEKKIAQNKKPIKKEEKK